MTVAFAYSPSLLPGSPSAPHPGQPPSTRSSHFRQVLSPPLPRHPQAGLVQQTPVLTRVLGPERGRGSQGTERGWEEPEVSKAPGSPHFLTAAGPWLTPTQGRAGGAGSRPSWAWGAGPLGAPRFWGLAHPGKKTSQAELQAPGSRECPSPPPTGCTCLLVGASQSQAWWGPGPAGRSPNALGPWALPRADGDRASRRPELRATGGLSRLCLSGGVTGEMAGGPPPHTRRSACFFPHRLSGPKPAPHRPGCPQRFCRRLVACRELG